MLKIIIAAVCVISFLCKSVDGLPDSEGSVDPTSDYQAAVDRLVLRLKRRTARRGYNYCTSERMGTDQAFGHASYVHGIATEACRECLQAADDIIIFRRFGFPEGAKLRLGDCHMRYLDYQFIDR